MNLNSLDIEIRPRTNWEAFDLGKSIIGKYWKSIYGPWLICNFILVALISPIVFYSIPLAVFVYLYFAPMAERVVLLIISRAVFGETLTCKQSLKMWPGQLKAGLFSYYFFYRLLPNRAMILPVWQLENLKGKALSSRLKIISHRASNTAGWAGLFFCTLEQMVSMAMLMLLFSFLPAGLVDWEAFWVDFFLVGPPDLLTIISFSMYFISILLLRPFHVASGFALYLHRRMVLEGWDIELQFRSLIARLAKVLIPGIVIFSFFQSPQAIAAEDPQVAIEKVMKADDFNKFKEIEGRRPKDSGKDRDFNPDMPDLSPVAFLFKIILILFIIGVVGALIYFIVTTLNNSKLELAKMAPENVPVRKIMGMDITEETMPENIAAEAERLIREGQLRAGLALLYRGALYRLVNHYGVALKKSFTENDCLRAVKSPVPGDTIKFFKDLTNQWLLLAYAHVEPNQEQALSFCRSWNRAFKSSPPKEVNS